MEYSKLEESHCVLNILGGSLKNLQETQFVKHYVKGSDTIQGIALKYDVTIEQILRANRLLSTDSLLLREFLFIPTTILIKENPQEKSESYSNEDLQRIHLEEEEEKTYDKILNKVDESIALAKEELKKNKYSKEDKKFTTLEVISMRQLENSQADNIEL